MESARRSGGFDEFSRTDLVDQARSPAADLNAVPDPNAFVTEIVERSRLLVDVGDGTRYVFAHRSIRVFLAAERWRLAGDTAFLLDRAANQEWRQVRQFYAVGPEQEQANYFLPRPGLPASPSRGGAGRRILVRQGVLKVEQVLVSVGRATLARGWRHADGPGRAGGNPAA